MIYFVQGTITKNIKIGFTYQGDIKDRMSQLNSSDPLICLGILPDLDAGPATEKRLHIRFKHLSSHGEWFRPGPDLLAFIEAIPKTSESNVIYKPKPLWEKYYSMEAYADKIERDIKYVEGCVKFYPYTESDGPRWNAILIFKCPQCNGSHKNTERGKGEEPESFLTECKNVRGQVRVFKYGKMATNAKRELEEIENKVKSS